MPFQPNASVNTTFWRYQTTDSAGTIVDEVINLAEVKKIKINRANLSPNNPQVKVWFWFDTDRLDSRDAGLTIGGASAVEFISDLDAIFSNG